MWTLWLNGLWVIMIMMTALWLASVWLKDASIVDPFWGMGFVVLAGYYFHKVGIPSLQQTLLLVMTGIWGLRLFVHLAIRNFGKGEDYRYRQFRENYGKDRYWWVSFFQVFLLQGVLLWLVSATIFGGMVGNAANQLTPLFLAGVLVWFTGFVFEAGGDYQLYRFKSRPSNKGKILDKGFWRYTRHPNYFGDSMVWWGFALISISNQQYLAVLGAALMTFLLIQISGVRLLEKNLHNKRAGYKEYVRRTPAFFPWFPKSGSEA